jgi:hypothetical protein
VIKNDEKIQKTVKKFVRFEEEIRILRAAKT